MESLQPIVVDACVAINVRAGGRWSEVFRAGGWSPLMPSIAFEEVLYLFDENGDRTRVSLSGLVQEAQLASCELDSDQLDLMLSMVADLGAGEAASIALARSRGLALATDDRAARRHPLAQACRHVTTPELMCVWAEKSMPDPETVGQVLGLIETRASYRPPNDDPYAPWWRAQRPA